MKIRVYYEDTDTGKVVYHSNYLNFCERARSEFFFSRGQSPLSQEGGFVVVSLEAKFKIPAKLGDMLSVKTEVLSVKGSSLSLKQSVYKDAELLFDMDIRLGFIKDGKIGRMSSQMQEDIRAVFS